jgi:hypothetical protein
VAEKAGVGLHTGAERERVRVRACVFHRVVAEKAGLTGAEEVGSSAYCTDYRVTTG